MELFQPFTGFPHQHCSELPCRGADEELWVVSLGPGFPWQTLFSFFVAMNLLFCFLPSFCFETSCGTVALAALELTIQMVLASKNHRDLVLFASQVLGWKAYITIPGHSLIFFTKTPFFFSFLSVILSHYVCTPCWPWICNLLDNDQFAGCFFCISMCPGCVHTCLWKPLWCYSLGAVYFKTMYLFYMCVCEPECIAVSH